MTYAFKLAKRLSRSRSSGTRLLAVAILLAGCADAIGTEPTDSALDTLSAASRVAAVIVTPGTASGTVGQSAQFSAVAKDPYGRTRTELAVSWSSSNTAVVSVTSAGFATAIGGGSATVNATIGGVTGQAAVTVTGATITVANVTVSPGSASGSVGQAAQFTATVTDGVGAAITAVPVVWTTSDAGVITVTPTGYVTAVGGGSAQVIATAGGKSGQAAITVTGSTTQPAPVATIALSPVTVSIGIGSIQPITATLRDAAGNVLSGRSVTWTSSSPLIGSITTVGAVTGLLTGTTTITATSEGKNGTATVTVTAVAPPPPTGGTWAHEPSGYPLVSENAFDALTGNGWNIAWNDRGLGSIVQDNTAPLSPSSVLQMSYPIGYTGGVGPANVWRPLNNLRRMYTGFMFKVSDPWQGHPSNVNKILFAFPSSGGDIYLTMYGPPGGPYELRVLPQYPGITSDWLRPNVNNPKVTLGTWHKIEWNIDYSAGGTNGVVQWWMDGQLVGDYRNTQVPAGGFAEFKINPTWGGLDDSKRTNDFFRYDQIHISGN